jgi:peptidoglycan hydrolase CwlO-like protein
MKRLLILAIGFFATLVLTGNVYAQSDSQRLEELNRQIAEYATKLSQLQAQASTLSNEVAKFDAQIKLAELKISQTEEQIKLLGGRIDELEGSLSALSDAFSSRAVETYKMSRVREPVALLLGASDLPKAISRYHYLRKIQVADRELLIRLQSTQNTYIDQKDKLEELQVQLEEQKKALDSQKRAKANLLALTRNDEKKYSQLLAAARAELEAIQAIVAGRGQESPAGHVDAGQRIASVIPGASCNSGGEHLHFIVSENGITKNPFSLLKSVDHENCSGSSCGSSDGDPFNPSGSWEWPVPPLIKFSQGYGATWATRNTWVGRIYNFHNGIDIRGTSSEVKAVKSGNLFRGSYTGSAGCRLRYVRVDHDEDNLDTFYLHVNY